MKGFTSDNDREIHPEIQQFLSRTIESGQALFTSSGINNLWLPLPKKTISALSPNQNHQIQYEEIQKRILGVNEGEPKWPWPKHWHLALEDGNSIMTPIKTLYGTQTRDVMLVRFDANPQRPLCVRKSFHRWGHNTFYQKKVFEAFKQEIEIMRRVSQRHCVELVGSYTDDDHVAIISSPKADMDLAAYMDLPQLSTTQLRVLRQGIGCLCGALEYLHRMLIRHEDLKPANILVHGDNILVTDFGASADFSDDGLSTTSGTPTGLNVTRPQKSSTMNHEVPRPISGRWGVSFLRSFRVCMTTPCPK